MNIVITQKLSLKQKLTLTPAIQQSLNILSMNNQELSEYIEDKIEGNPFLHHKNSLLEKLVSESRAAPRAVWANEKNDYISNLTSTDHGMEHYLYDQLLLEKQCKGKEKYALLYFVQNLTDRGYLNCDLEVVQRQFQLTNNQVEKVLNVLQQFEPAGIGARSLSESLLLQLRDFKQIPKHVESIITHHLELIAYKNLEELCAIYECDEDEIEDVICFIQSLKPYPVEGLQSEELSYFIPDLNVDLYGNQIVLTVNNDFSSDFIIEETMDEIYLNDTTLTDFTKEKLNEALLLKTGIDKRNATLYMVANAVLDAQPDFLKTGKTRLRPLKLADIAKVVNLHESTIWRTIKDKYINTPHGILKLSEFFVRGIKKADGYQQSVHHIKERIKELILFEDFANPYTDQAIVEQLRNEKIEIARRTVAKYRKEMGIKSSKLRFRGNK